MKTFVKFLMLAAAWATLTACGSSSNLIGAGGLAEETPAPPAATAEPAFTATPIPEPYGHIVFVSNRDGQMDLYLAAPNGAEQTRLTINAEDDIAPRLSPDGGRVAFTSTVAGNMDIYVLDLSSGGITRVTDAPEKDSSPSWSPDGQRLAFESFRDGNFEIYVVNVDGSGLMRLTDDRAGDGEPAWSPVSDEIAFVSDRFGNSDVMLVAPGGNPSTLTTASSPDSAPAWSPDGGSLAYKSGAGDIANICVIGRDGLNQRCLTSAPAEYSAPVWSPDGQWVAANGKVQSGYGINVFNAADGALTQLSQPGIDPRGVPAWSPDSLRLVVQSKTGGNMELFSALILTNEFSQLTNHPAYDGEPVWSAR
ncbi:MAG: hypothetical protein Fur002_18070 [Anaerolineales bacterium]